MDKPISKPCGRPPKPLQGRGEIRGDAVYPIGVLMRRLDISRNTLTSLRRQGLKESLDLYWDRHDRLHIDLTGKRPRLSIPAELEKGNRDRLLPITPDFAAHLLATEDAARRGPVFRPFMPSGNRANADQAGRMISLMGELAGVKVHTHAKTGKVKFASAHDLRRSFGTRWARRVPTAVLMRLMRHESIQTTNAYYVDLNADEVAEDLYRSFGGVGSVFGSVAPADGENEGEGDERNHLRLKGLEE